MDETRYPYVPDAVIKYLESNFPNKYPMEETATYQLGYGAGIQWLIQHLKTVKQWSEESVQD